MAKITENIPLHSTTAVELEGTGRDCETDSDSISRPDDLDVDDNNKGILLDTKINIDGKPKIYDDEYKDVFDVVLDESCWCKCCVCGCCGTKCKFGLTPATIFAAILGASIGVLIQEFVIPPSDDEPPLDKDIQKLIAFPGKLWINGLKLLVLPLIALMMVILPSRIDNVNRIAKTAIPFFIFTSVCSALQGTVWVNIIQPGKNGEKDITTSFDSSDFNTISEMDAVLGIFEKAIPENIITAMNSIQILGVITFFFGYGVLLRNVNEKDKNTVLSFCKALLRCTMVAVTFIVWLTPIGMFSMVLSKIVSTKNFFGLFKALGWYIITVLIGHTGHVFIVLPIITGFVARINPYKHFCKILPAPLFAFATSSSAATLPRSIEVAEVANVERKIYNFILPLGAAINMDGTALGFPIMIMFIAQLFQIEIEFGRQIAVMLLAIVISIGTAPIPNAGMVYLVLLLEVAELGKITDEAMSILLMLDWFVDRIETSVNVTSDQFICKMVDKIEQKRLED